MKNFIIIALILFVAWVFLGKKAENLKEEALGQNLNNQGNATANPQGGENIGTAIVQAAGDAVNLLIDRAFARSQANNPPDTQNQTL